MVNKAETLGWERRYPFLQKAPGALGPACTCRSKVPFTRELSIFRTGRRRIMVALAPILRLVRENSSVGNFCFLFKHFSEAPTPVLNREVEKSGSHARVRYTGPLGQRFPWSFLRENQGTGPNCNVRLSWYEKGQGGRAIRLTSFRDTLSLSPLNPFLFLFLLQPHFPLW